MTCTPLLCTIERWFPPLKSTPKSIRFSPPAYFNSHRAQKSLWQHSPTALQRRSTSCAKNCNATNLSETMVSSFGANMMAIGVSRLSMTSSGLTVTWPTSCQWIPESFDTTSSPSARTSKIFSANMTFQLREKLGRNWRELQHRLATAPAQIFTPDYEYHKLEPIGPTVWREDEAKEGCHLWLFTRSGRSTELFG
jgi:hypothetical protein